jgi:uncharacterized SAM-binding protein YcdF (DUF218 family)
VNSLFVLLGIESWKPVLSVLILPPVPFLLLTLAGARLILSRRGLGWLLVLLSAAGLWLSMCAGTGRLVERLMLHVPPALSADRIRALKADARGKGTDAIVVLGGGVEPFAPEYGTSNLGYYSLERLRYAMWLGRETGLPVAFSGGAGWAQAQDTAEADVAARIAAQDYRQPLRWTENASRDTRENASHTLPLMTQSGITHIVLVTHGWHMQRARRAFEDAARAHGITVEAAPMGLATRIEMPALDWMPTTLGYARVRNALREWLGWVLGT